MSAHTKHNQHITLHRHWGPCGWIPRTKCFCLCWVSQKGKHWEYGLTLHDSAEDLKNGVCMILLLGNRPSSWTYVYNLQHFPLRTIAFSLPDDHSNGDTVPKVQDGSWWFREYKYSILVPVPAKVVCSTMSYVRWAWCIMSWRNFSEKKWLSDDAQLTRVILEIVCHVVVSWQSGSIQTQTVHKLIDPHRYIFLYKIRN